MRTGLRIILYTNVDTEVSPNFEDEMQARVENIFDNDIVELEHVEFEYEND